MNAATTAARARRAAELGAAALAAEDQENAELLAWPTLRRILGETDIRLLAEQLVILANPLVLQAVLAACDVQVTRDTGVSLAKSIVGFAAAQRGWRGPVMPIPAIHEKKS